MLSASFFVARLSCKLQITSNLVLTARRARINQTILKTKERQKRKTSQLATKVTRIAHPVAREAGHGERCWQVPVVCWLLWGVIAHQPVHCGQDSGSCIVLWLGCANVAQPHSDKGLAWVVAY